MTRRSRRHRAAQLKKIEDLSKLRIARTMLKKAKEELAAMKAEEKEGHHSQLSPSCFVCCVDIGLNQRTRKLSTPDHYNFFLNELLEVPSGKSLAYLKQLGRPSDWIRLCDSCQLTITNGKMLRKRIDHFQEMLKQCKKDILEAMKDTIDNPRAFKSEPIETSTSTSCIAGTQTLEMILNFVSGKTYPILDEEDDEAYRPPEKRKRMLTAKFGTGTEESDSGSFNEEVEYLTSPVVDNVQDEDPLAMDSIEVDDEEPTLHLKNKIYCGLCDDNEVYATQAELIAHTSSCHNLSTRGSTPIPSTSTAAPVILETSKSSRTTNTKKKSGDLGVDSNDQRSREKWLYKYYQYNCPNCPQVKRYSMMQYAQHLAIHLKSPFQCSKCLEFFSDDTELREQHWREKHPESQDNLTSDAPTFIKIKFDPGQIWKCEKCLKGFFSADNRDDHEPHCIKRHTLNHELKLKAKKPPPRQCELCQLNFRNYPEWRFHRLISHPEVDRGCCHYCDKSFWEKTVDGLETRHDMKMLDHMISEHAGDEFGKLRFQLQIRQECSNCGLVFDDLHQHHKHFVEKHGIPDAEVNRCPICPKMYSNVMSLRKHISFHHFQSETTNCDICGHRFFQLKILANHKLISHGIEPEPGERYKIRVCPKEGCSFKAITPVALRRHIKMTHESRSRPHTCSFCGKAFLDSNKLKYHEEIHKNKESKPFQCEICGNSFAVQNYLYIHKRLTHERRTFPSTNKKKAPRKPKTGSRNETVKSFNQPFGGVDVDSQAQNGRPSTNKMKRLSNPRAKIGGGATTVNSQAKSN